MDTSAEMPTYDVIEYLKNTQLDWNNTIPYLPEIKYGKVIKVYDGDTITIATPLFNGDNVPRIETYRFNIRLRGINTPELRTKNSEERNLAIESRDYLASMVMDKIVRLENLGVEKYGRLLCDVFVEDPHLHINSAMIDSGFAVAFMV